MGSPLNLLKMGYEASSDAVAMGYEASTGAVGSLISIAGKGTEALGNLTPTFNGAANGSSAALTITVTGYSDTWLHTEYIIQSVYGPQGSAQEHEAKQRFSAFIALHESLGSKLGPEPAPFPLPKALFVSEELKKERKRRTRTWSP